MQRRRRKEARLVGVQIQLDVSAFLGGLDVDTRDYGAGAIGNDAGNHAGVDLGKRNAGNSGSKRRVRM